MLFFIVCVCTAWAQTVATVPETTVQVQAVAGDIVNSHAQIGIAVRNDSPKIITAMAWIMERKYPDGSVQEGREHTVDWITDLLTPGQSFTPGSTRKITDLLPAGTHGENPLATALTALFTTASSIHA